MKFKTAVLLAAVAFINFGLWNVSFGFHAGGVGACEGCHSMHNSFGGEPFVTGRSFAMGPGAYLLRANDSSSACLNCHNATDAAPNAYHVSTSGIMPYDNSTPVEMTPGGDFAWLKKTMNVIAGATTILDGNIGDRHGHNILAQDFGYYQDATLTQAPGGSYPSTSLTCTSCHDPHGSYRRFADGTYGTTGLPIFDSGSYDNSPDPISGVAAVGAYRMFGGYGYLPKFLIGGLAFMNNPPDAVVASDYNRSETSDQTGVAYGQGMSEWCANCHPGILQQLYLPGQHHPAANGAKLTAVIAAKYNSYVSEGNMTNINTAKAWSTLAPFELGTNNRTVLKPQAVTGTGGDSRHTAASTTANVMCLSCHRAHASAFKGMLRFAYGSGDFMTLTDSANNVIYDSATGGGGYSQAQLQTAYYGRPAEAFGPFARPYCVKCHG